MFEALNEVPLDVAHEAVYQVMWRFHHRAPHHDANDNLVPGAPELPHTQTLRTLLREIREAEGCRISQLSDEATSRYSRMLSEMLEARTPPLTPEQERRALEILEEMREKYGRAA